MKKMRLIVFIVVLLFLTSCSGSVTRAMFGLTEKKLIETVSMEQDCPKEKIKILQSNKGLHGATYALDVCGKRVIYKQVGTVFMEASQTNNMLK